MENLTLAITTIGDLMLNNRITRKKDGKPIENIRLVIPDYQRPYKWTARNAIQLVDDVIEAMNDNKEIYRVGTLILHHDEKKSIYNIVDGQQRVTTFALLLLALLEEKEIKFVEQQVADNPFTRENVANNYRAFERRRDAMAETQANNNSSDGKRTDETEKKRNDRNVKDLRDYIENQCELIVVITNDISEAFQFFDSQNARGKKLYPHDLLKAYHLREMSDVGVEETEKIVKRWEEAKQNELADLFGEYLFRVREWLRGNYAWELSEHNIDKFKGISIRDNSPYAQFFKGAFAYADMVNRSAMPFVSGMRNLNPFQLDAPIIAGKPFFDYTSHYFEILKDIQNNDKYVGYFVNDNEIVKTLDLPKYRNGVGNRITRKLFDLAALLYVDRFCPDKPTQKDLDLFDQFLVLNFIWAYSLRAQYYSLGWASAQKYIMGNSDAINSFNLYKYISESPSPTNLLSELADRIKPLPKRRLAANVKVDNIDGLEKEGSEVYSNYLHYFNEHKFYTE
jgi:hypothetical protein